MFTPRICYSVSRSNQKWTPEEKEEQANLHDSFLPIFSPPPTSCNYRDFLSLLLRVHLTTLNHLSSRYSSNLSLNQCPLVHPQYILRRNYMGLLSVVLKKQLFWLHLMPLSPWNERTSLPFESLFC